MKPIEIERPWISKKLGLKVLGSVFVVFILAFALLAIFGFYTGGTVNIQSVDVSFSGHKINSYSYAYGKTTFSSGEKIILNVELKNIGGTNITNITGVKTIGNGFSATLTQHSFQLTGGVKTIPVLITMPDHNYAGNLSLEFMVL